MFPPGRSTLYAALFSCVLHISGLGITATLLVSAPAKFSPPVKVTLLQRTVPLPMQEGQEPAQEVASPFLPSKALFNDLSRPQRFAPPKPVATKKPPQMVRTVPLAPIVTDSPRLPIAPALPAPQEESPRLAMAVPPAATSVTDSAKADEPALVSKDLTGTGDSGREERSGSVGGRTSGGSGSRAEGGGGISVRPDYGANPKPPYPLIAGRIGAQGVVLLRVHVRQDGSVASVELARSS